MARTLLAMVLVVVLVAIGAAVLIGGGFAAWLVSRARKSRARLAGELARDPAVRGPEPAVYRGSTGGYSQVLGNGRIALTEQRLLFQKAVGSLVVVPRRSITGVSTAKVFNRGVVGARTHLVVHTATGDVGFFVTDLDGWVAALSPAGTPPTQPKTTQPTTEPETDPG